MDKIGIYIHIPFCAKKCPYCDFYSCNYSKNIAERYTDSVINEIKHFKDGLSADTVYFGGGTPSLISENLIGKILNALNNKFFLDDPEITIEVNPCTVNSQKLYEYRKMGINRLSVGVQSANDDELIFLGRKHNFEKAVKVINAAHCEGFKNISCDIMTGLPKQNFKKLLYTIEEITALPVTHISSYILKIEENTPFNTKHIIDSLPDDDYIAELYLFMVEKLISAGFSQYEISNFSKTDFESKHNLKYWRCKEYIGFGSSAHSFYNGKRFFNPHDLDKYIANNGKIEKVITEENPASDSEKIMLGLRLSEGINAANFPMLKEKILKKAMLLESAGFIRINGTRISLTPKGFLVSNSIINELI